MLFLNIGWMARYEGLVGQPDNIVNGGKWVRDNDTGHEVCNFLTATDGYVYGHVESSRGDIDRQMNFENLGIGEGKEVSDIDIVWTATSPEGGRYVVGWYKHATLFRKRKTHKKSPSKQHRRDNVTDYRTKASAENAFLLPLEDRTLRMPKGKGWMGHTQWWAPPKNIDDEEMIIFFDFLDELMGGAVRPLNADHNEDDDAGERGSGGTAKSSYTRYVEKFEVRITPRHHELQKAFAEFIRQSGATDIIEDRNNVDLKFSHPNKGKILSEIKPCSSDSVRFAIRTAIGQLLDYKQKTACDGLLIVVDAQPSDADKELALHNGFGLAYPKKTATKFKIEWPI